MDQNRSRKQKESPRHQLSLRSTSQNLSVLYQPNQKIQYKDPTFADIRDNKGIERLDGLEKYFIAATTHTPIW